MIAIASITAGDRFGIWTIFVNFQEAEARVYVRQ